MKYIRLIFSAPYLFALFLFAGYFKSSLPFIPIDLTFLLLVSTLALAVIKIIKGNNIYVYPILIWLFLLVMATFSLFYTQNLIVGIDKYLRLVIVSTWAFLGPIFLFNTRNDIKNFILGLLTVGIVMGISSLFNGQNELGFLETLGSSYQSLSRISGSISLMLISISIFSNLEPKNRLISLIGGLVLILPMFMSGGRLTSIIYIAFIFVIFPLMLVSVERSKIKISNRIGTYVSIIILFIFVVIYGVYNKWFETYFYRINVIFQETKGGASVGGRLDRMHAGWEMVKENPIIGQGLGDFSLFFPQGLKDDTPHNVFIEVWAEMGLLGLISFSCIFFIGLISLIRYGKVIKEDWVYISLSTLTMFWIINTFISSGLTGSKILFGFLSVSIIASKIVDGKFKKSHIN